MGMVESTTANGKIIICMARAYTPGKMVVCTRATTRMTVNTAMVSTPGTTANSTKAGGKMESNTAKEPTEKTAATEEDTGKTERESNGSVEKKEVLRVSNEEKKFLFAPP